MSDGPVQFDEISGFDLSNEPPPSVHTELQHGSGVTSTYHADVADPSPVIDARELDISFFDQWDLWQTPIASATITGALLGWIGVYIVLSRASFTSAAVSNVSSLGTVAAVLFLGLHTHDMADMAVAKGIGVLLGTLSVAMFGLGRYRARLPSDARLAIIVIMATAGTLFLGSKLTSDYQLVRDLVYGDAVVATTLQFSVIGLAATVLMAIHIPMRFHFITLLFDPDTAAAQGIQVQRTMALLSLSIGFSVAIATTGVGALTAFAFAVLPAGTALRYTNRHLHTLLLSAALGAASAMVGYYIAFRYQWPTGASMVVVLGILYVLSLLRREP